MFELPYTLFIQGEKNMSNQYNEQFVNPIIESSLRFWREQGGLYRLEGSKCTACETKYFPRRFVCPKCHSLNLEIFRFSGIGTLENVFANNIPQIAILGYGEHQPRYMATIKLKEGPVILGEIIDVDNTELLKNGTKLKMVIRKQARSLNQNWCYGYKFKILEEGT
jgi:uncharacterized OB-fold protein